jgi:HEAT repeat protein
MKTHRILIALTVAAMIGSGSVVVAEPHAGHGHGASDADAAVAVAIASKDQEEVRKRLEFLLSGYEYFPSRADLDRLAPPEVIIGLLQAMVDETDLRPTLRLRAIDALSLFEPGAVRGFLLAILATDLNKVPASELRVADLMRHRAINSLARLDGEAAVEALLPFLDDADLQIRLTAISALGQFAGQPGKKAIEDLKRRDSHPAVQREINKHLLK